MISFSRKTLELLPTPSLVSLTNSMITRKQEKIVKLSSVNSRISKLTGTYSISLPQGGRYNVKGGNSSKTVEDRKKEQIVPTLGAVTVIETIQASGTTGKPFVEGTTVSHNEDDVASMVSEVRGFYSGEIADEEIDVDGSVLQGEVQDLTDQANSLVLDIKDIESVIDSINDILSKRTTGALPSPVINVTDLEIELDSRGKARIAEIKEFIENRIITPYIENDKRINQLKAQLKQELNEEPLFDFVFGPPVSTGGKFILSDDGIYYDSRIGGIYDKGVNEYLRQIFEIENRKKKLNTGDLWKLEYAPNIGGKGIPFGKADIDSLKNTIFSEVYDMSSADLELFYINDDILQAFEDDKRAHLEEINGQISGLMSNGYSATDSVVRNAYQSVAAIANAYDSKIVKRRKQLQLAALFGPYRISKKGDPFGEGNLYHIEKDGTETRIERIPVNDFSFLQETGTNVSVEQQKNITLFSEDLDDVILPIEPKFLVSPPGSAPAIIPSFNVDIGGKGSWVNMAEGYQYTDEAYSSTTAYVKSITDEIVTDGLLVCYNFLDKEISNPSSVSFKVDNVAEGSTKLNAMLVAHDAKDVFLSGLGIPFLRGTQWDRRGKYGISFKPMKGSYVRLPNNIQGGDYNKNTIELDNLFSSPRGATIEFWVHASHIHSEMTEEHRYRLVLANENSGKPFSGNRKTTATKATRLVYDIEGNPRTDPNKVHGMIIGFRDRGHVGVTPSGLEFVICPTVGQNDNTWGHSVCIAEDTGGNEYGVIIPSSVQTAVKNKNIKDVENEFLHFAISFDPAIDTVNVFCDGELLTTSSITASFGTSFEDMNIPSKVVYDSAAKNDPAISWWNSFYSTSGTGDPLVLPEGSRIPQNPVIFTPWIIGGGYTDAIGYAGEKMLAGPGGFLGANTNDSYWGNGAAIGDHFPGQHTPGLGGFRVSGTSLVPRSGLDGNVGSFKIYTKALSLREAKKNYDAQKGFFKKIQTRQFNQFDVSGYMSDGFSLKTIISIPVGKMPSGGWPLLVSIPSTGNYRTSNFATPLSQELARSGYVIISVDHRSVGSFNADHSYNFAANTKEYYTGDGYRIREILDIFEAMDLAISSVSSLVTSSVINTDKIGVYGGSNGGVGSLFAARLSGQPVSGLRPLITEAEEKLTASGYTTINDWGYSDSDTFRTIKAVSTESAISTDLSALALRDYISQSPSAVTSLSFMRRLYRANANRYNVQTMEDLQPLIFAENYSGIANWFNASGVHDIITGPYPVSSVTIPTDMYLSWNDLQYSPYLALHKYISLHPSTTPVRVEISTGHHGSPTNYEYEIEKCVRQVEWLDKYVKGIPNGVDTDSKYKLSILPNSTALLQDYFYEFNYIETDSYPVNDGTLVYYLSGNGTSGTLETTNTSVAGSSIIEHNDLSSFTLSGFAAVLSAGTDLTDTQYTTNIFDFSTVSFESDALTKDILCVGTPSASFYVSGNAGGVASGIQVVIGIYERTDSADIYVGGGVTTTNTNGGYITIEARPISYRFRSGKKFLLKVATLFLQTQVLETGTSYVLTWEALPYGHDFSFLLVHDTTNPASITFPTKSV